MINPLNISSSACHLTQQGHYFIQFIDCTALNPHFSISYFTWQPTDPIMTNKLGKMITGTREKSN